MNNSIAPLIYAVFALTFFGLFGIFYSISTFFIDSELAEQAKILINKCEQQLPRDQKCVLSAVPAE